MKINNNVTLSELESPYFYANKNFLLEDYNISYTPSSIIFIAQNKKAETGGNRNLLIGEPYIIDSEYSLSVRSGLVELNPSSSRNISLFPLKYSKDEIKSIDQTIASYSITLCCSFNTANPNISFSICINRERKFSGSPGSVILPG